MIFLILGSVLLGGVFIFLSVQTFSFMLFESPLLSLLLKFSGSLTNLIFGVSVLAILLHILFFSNFYMSSEMYLKRFMFILFIFVSSMLLLIFSDSPILILSGWDGLGVSSFLLVIWYQSWGSLASGWITYMVNRFGDFFLIWGVIFFALYPSWVSVIWGGAMFAALTKSAQAPFSAWLPAAMSAPTPVSALVHSSTLVTAGVFLVLKLSPCGVWEILLWSGGATLLASGVISLGEMDFKKIVALSTLSQLGLLMVSVSCGGTSYSLLHLVSHAFIKSGIFIIVGVLLHSLFSSQDKRLFGGLHKTSSLVFVSLSVCSFSLMGLFFLSGFVSKDLILLSFLSKSSETMITSILLLGASFTFLYATRMMSTTFSWMGTASSSWAGSLQSGSSFLGLTLLSCFSIWYIFTNFMVFNLTSGLLEKFAPLLMLFCASWIWSSWSASSHFRKKSMFFMIFGGAFGSSVSSNMKWVDRSTSEQLALQSLKLSMSLKAGAKHVSGGIFLKAILIWGGMLFACL